jgi:hypothetical protein
MVSLMSMESPDERDLQSRSVYSEKLTAAADLFNKKYFGGRLRRVKVFIITRGVIPGRVGEHSVDAPKGAWFRATGHIYILNTHAGYSKSQILLHELVHEHVDTSHQSDTQHDARFIAESQRIERLTGFKIYLPERHARCPGGVCARR